MVQSVRLINFKNHPDISCECRDLNVFLGKNGSGKTNILEAIYLLLNAKTLPGTAIADCVRSGENAMVVTLIQEEEEIPVKYAITYDSEKKKGNYLISGAPVSREKYLSQIGSRAVFFSPMEMNVLYLGPELRRDFLDETLTLSFPAFARVKSEYGRILKQRNRLLKDISDGRAQENDLDFWDQALAKSAVAYYRYRLEFVQFIQEHIDFLSELLEQKYSIRFSYETKADLSDLPGSIEAYLQQKRQRDLIVGHTYIGPHLDDFSFLVQIGEDEKHTTDYLSRGENKTLLL